MIEISIDVEINDIIHVETIQEAIDSLKAYIPKLEEKIEWTRIKNDPNGNPRYVCHFLNFLSKEEIGSIDLNDQYELALNRAHKLGGRKFHNKQYGGGIVFQSYNLDFTETRIKESNS